jgi:hypothetical protein
MTRTRRPSIARVKVPEDHAKFVHIPGQGWHVVLTWNWGDTLRVDVDVGELAALLASAKDGEVVVARRLTRVELKRFTAARADADRECYAYAIHQDRTRWRPPGRR